MGATQRRKRGLGIAIIGSLLSVNLWAQPKLVVQVVVDQMRAEYLQRFDHQFAPDGGFRMLIDSGFSYSNTHYNYIPTYTGPGHASISTGTTPKYHGVVANDWWDNRTASEVYCAQDMDMKPVGTVESSSKRSPKNLRSLTFSDGIKLYTNNQGKSFGVSVKDRGAIFPAGHMADGAYWLDGAMHFVTSTYYTNELPEYLQDFNSKELAMKQMRRGWRLELSPRKYELSLEDENPFEPKLNNETSSFPYDLEKMVEQRGLGILKNTPIGNEMVLEMALLLLKEEDLGSDEFTDFLGVSFSSPDYAGHTWGVRSREVHDMYLKLDAQLGQLIKVLDKEVGRDQYIIYLTADHGASENPNHLRNFGYDVRNYANADVVAMLNDAIVEEMDVEVNLENAVSKIINHHLYLNDWAKPYAEEIAKIIEQVDPFVHVYTANEVRRPGNEELALLLHEGYQTRFAGDLIFQLQPNCIFYGPTGSTHGTGYTYDTHVPFLMMGAGVSVGSSHEKMHITDVVDKVAEKAYLPYAPNSLIH
ncbi:MAG: alkaline phosphatase family protein [Schleiferiaceae bacterium]|nr:alkaline phosphatase family protein [Schleiferiaceae bacterium]